MRHDILSDVMFTLNNADKFGKKECTVGASGIIKNVLKVLQDEAYIGNFEFVDDHKSGKFRVEMKGKINHSRAVKPRFSVGASELKKWEVRFLPSRNMGILIVSTPIGVMTQKGVRESGMGGKILACVY